MADPTPHPEHHLPSAHDTVAQTLVLLQPWINFVPQQQRRLGLFIFVAFLVHVAAFYFIRIDTARAELRHQERTHVTVEYPQAIAVNGQAAEDIWDRLTDPRLFLLPLPSQAGVIADELPTALNSSLASKDLPPAVVPEDYRAARPAITPLEQRVGEAMRPPRQPFAYDETPPVVATKTTWQWDDALGQRQPTALPDLPSPISDTDLSPTHLRVAIGPGGAVEHVMVEQSSGGFGASIAKDLDQQAALAAGKIRFKPTDQPGLVWGRLTVFWRYSAKPREEVLPTPPSAP